ncbi:MAG TPA: hypothetical protein VMH83_11190, partial [Candidatus Acidoferrum sp.]|nr:hypothetical protein [Candidatus Acidoferrum sp.]
MIWWIVVIILALIVMRRFWAAFNHPTNMLGKQAAYMNWVAGGFYNDKDGYKNVLFKRGNYEAFISYKKCKVFLVKPANYEPFDDFLAVERWLAEVEVDRPSAHQFGYHISELAIALETHQLYAMDNKIYFAEKSNGRDIYWNCCVSLYASILYAKEKSGVQMELMTWNSFAHSIVVGMVDRQNPSSIMGTPQYQAV